MPREWLVGVKRRSVEKDYRFYDPPSVIWKKISSRTWNYKTKKDFYELRDLALMCVMYISAARVSEIVRAEVKGGFLPSIRKEQFVKIGNFLMLRKIPVVKRRYVKTIDDYPFRDEIPFPLKGSLKIFTEPIMDYLELLDDKEELFKFGTKRAFQIVNYVTGEFPHYLRDMGLKMWLRRFGKDLVQLQQFSGHRYLRNLARYLRGNWRDYEENIFTMSLDE